MKVGDLVEVNGSVGVLLEIIPKKVPPYNVCYKVLWQNKEDYSWLLKSQHEPPLKKL